MLSPIPKQHFSTYSLSTRRAIFLDINGSAVKDCVGPFWEEKLTSCADVSLNQVLGLFIKKKIKYFINIRNDAEESAGNTVG